MKKLISLILCAALMLSMGGAAFADWGERTNSPRYSILNELVKQMDAQKNKTDSTSSASPAKPAAISEHVSLGIKIPSLDSFLGRRLDIYLYDVLKNYVHICYEDRVYEEELEDYMELLEDEYDFELAIYDWTRGIYAYDYYEQDIWTLYPGYGYKDEDDVAFMIVHDGDFTHVYYSIDFDYCDIEDCGEDDEDDPLSLENWEKFQEEQEKERVRKILERRNKSDIELPDMGRFYGREFDDYSEELTQSYSHLCYETEYDFDDIESYVELLEDDYKLKRIYPKGFDLEEGQYCLAYKGKGDVETFSPEYYGLGMEMAVFIACYPKYTHIYFSNDFNYDYWGDTK